MRQICLVLSLVLVMSVAACGNKKNLVLPKNQQTQNQQPPATAVDPGTSTTQGVSSNPASSR